MRMRPQGAGRWWIGFGCSLAMGCHSGGAAWTMEPNAVDVDADGVAASAQQVDLVTNAQRTPRRAQQYRVRSIGGDDGPAEMAGLPGGGLPRLSARHLDGRVLGTFRNTYYDFPSERQFEAPGTLRSVLKDAACKPIAEVSKAFHDTLCVQGSGRLASGQTVSFAKRDCACAEVCPKSGQRICYEALRPEAFPWGRGATGRSITPLLTVAVDTSIIPLDTAIYIPEFDGAPRGLEGQAKHDGCFIAQDRGVRVVGNHVDIFMGEPALTKLYNALVPSNQGVTLVLDSPRCARASVSAEASQP